MKQRPFMSVSYETYQCASFHLFQLFLSLQTYVGVGHTLKIAINTGIILLAVVICQVPT